MLLSDKEFVTVTDEAFALIVLENNWDLWCALGEDPGGVDVTNYEPKYTSLAKKAGRGVGWSLAGRERFTELTEAVQADRKTKGALAFEKAFMEAQELAKCGSKRKKAVLRLSDVQQRDADYLVADDMSDFPDSDDEEVPVARTTTSTTTTTTTTTNSAGGGVSSGGWLSKNENEITKTEAC